MNPTTSTQTMVTSMVSSTGELLTEMLPFGYLLFGLFIAVTLTAFMFASLRQLFIRIMK